MRFTSDTQRSQISDGEFSALFSSFGSRIYRYARSRVGPDAAEDVTAETFVQAWKSRARFESRDDVGADAWLLGVATNVIANHRRLEQRWLSGQVRAPHEVDAAESTEDGAIRHVSYAATRPTLAKALNSLSPKERDPFLLHVLADLSYLEVAQALDLPIGTVRSRISRCRDRLRGAFPHVDHPLNTGAHSHE